jgi:hypothetical protein
MKAKTKGQRRRDQDAADLYRAAAIIGIYGFEDMARTLQSYWLPPEQRTDLA